MDKPSQFPGKFTWPRPADDPLNLGTIPYAASRIHIIVRRLARLLDYDLSATLEDACDISILEWRVLSWLTRDGPMSQNELVGVAVMEQSHASRVLRSMKQKGYIEMSRDKKDLRRWICSVTTSGRERFEAAEPVMLARQARLDAMLSQEDMQNLFRSAHEVAVRVYAMHNASHPGTQTDEQSLNLGGKRNA